MDAQQASPEMAAMAPQDQTPGHPSFRRQRASRACETCHARKVRCDAASLGVPCTNCVAFQIECKIPAKRKKSTAKKERDRCDGEMRYTIEDDIADPLETSEPVESSVVDPDLSPSVRSDAFQSRESMSRGFDPEKHGINLASGMPQTEVSEAYAAQQKLHNGTWVQYMKPKFAHAPIKEAGRVAYLGESSNLSLLVQDQHGTTDVVHYPLPENIRGTRARMDELDTVEIDILHQRGAFLLPPRALCDELVEAFFQWIAPIVPVINRSKFMRRYQDPKNPPSLLLLQAILLAGSRVCTNSQLMDANGSTTPAAMTFYKRAKALYDANYEDDRVTIVQALILMGWYWEGPEDVTKNVFYWSRVAVIVAQGSGMHRSVEGSQLSRADKRLWKRIWWTLFTRDRSVAVALGRPCCINIEDSDVEMITADDFVDNEADRPAEYPADPTHVHFFLNYVKLCEIMGIVLAQNYSATSKTRSNNALDLTHSDMALADWLHNCPPEVKWEPQRHHFWSALLHANYYTTLCLLHRAHMPPAAPLASARNANGLPEETAYPSRTIAYQAAGMITSIIEALQHHDQLRFTPAFIVYSLFSALIMHVYQMRSSNQSIVAATQTRINTCMTALRDVSRVWLVAKMVHTLFESILGNKAFEERLQKAAGRRHAKKKGVNGAAAGTKTKESPSSVTTSEAQKRKFDEMELGYSNGPPAPQMSYERSRPQSPVADPNTQVPRISTHSPSPRQSEALLGASRPASRAMTPFNNWSYPGTPPDLFLHTRNSPKISEDLWQNYQPGQLFPPETNELFTMQSPLQNMVDPALRDSADPQQFNSTGLAQGVTPTGLRHHLGLGAGDGGGGGMPQAPMYSPQDLNNWNSLQSVAGAGGQRTEDQWSNSSHSGPVVPQTLNLGDWFEFFGIPNGDMGAVNGNGLESVYS